MKSILTSFADVLQEPEGLPPVRAWDHQISLILGVQPVNTRSYHYPHQQKTELERLVTEMLTFGIIRPSQSPFASPALLVQKGDGTWWLCVDYKALNQLTIKDKFPIPIIEELLDELHGARVFSKLDLCSSHH